jgi:hypothetical protein
MNKPCLLLLIGLFGLLPFVFCSCESTPACPPDGKFTNDAVRQILSGNLGSGDTPTTVNVAPSAESISFTILADQPEYLRLHIYPIIEASHRMAACSQRLRTVRVLMVARGAGKKSEYGTDLPSSNVPIVSLDIDCDDLRKFPNDFNWRDYGLYVANRYTRNLNVNIQDAWNKEVEEETKLGHFPQP